MNAEILLIIMLSLMVFNYLFSTILNYINDKNWKEDIPENMKKFYSKEAYEKARNYAKEKGKVGLISSTLSFLMTSLLLYFYGFGWVSDAIIFYLPEADSSSFSYHLLHTGTFFLVFFVLSDLISIPFSLLYHFCY